MFPVVVSPGLKTGAEKGKKARLRGLKKGAVAWVRAGPLSEKDDMSHTHARVFYHFVWSTWNREPLLVAEIEKHAYALIQQQCAEKGCLLTALGGIENHIHLLVTLPSTLCRAEFVKAVKGVSSHKLNEAHGSPTWAFKWQGRYGVHTVSPSHVSRLRSYIENQKQHHADGMLWPSCEQEDES